MTPKEKAKELFDMMSKQTFSYQEYAGAYYSVEEIGWEAGKKCALIAVDELIKEVNHSDVYYWQEVKQEIEKL
jgi:hypothetical protein